jgi:hypothetical protein
VIQGSEFLQDIYPLVEVKGKPQGPTGSGIRVEVAESDGDSCMIGWRKVVNDNSGGREEKDVLLRT